MLITSLFAATKHKNDTALVRLSFHFLRSVPSVIVKATSTFSVMSRMTTKIHQWINVEAGMTQNLYTSSSFW